MANQRAPEVSPAEVQEHLSGVDYPAGRDALVKEAKNQNAGEDVVGMLNQLPDRKYDSPVDVTKEIGKKE